MKEEAYKPLTVQELEEAFAIEDSADFKEFCEGTCENGRKGACCSNEKQSLWFARKNEFDSWKINGHAKGFAFVTPEDEPGMDDIFIPPTETNNAMHGDIVMVRVSSETSGSTPRRNGYPNSRTRYDRNSWDIFRK